MGITKIEWCINPDGSQGMSWNPVSGCKKISEGCLNCYSERLSKRFSPDNDFSEVRFYPKRLEEPMTIKKPKSIFVCSMNDLFYENIPMFEIAKIFDVIENCPQHTFFILTKRPERLLNFLHLHYSPERFNETLPKNIWFGVTGENFERVIERYNLLQKINKNKLFISIEPLLSSMFGLERYLDNAVRLPDWIMTGAETGEGRRKCNLEWFEYISDTCYMLGIPLFIKQIHICNYVVKDVSEFPNNLRIRKLPYLTKEMKNVAV